MADTNPEGSGPAAQPAQNGDNGSRGQWGGRGRGRGDRNQRGRGQRATGHGSKGGRQRGEAGRSDWARNPVDKRKRNEEEQAFKRRKVERNGEEHLEGNEASIIFSKEEIEAEVRRPKHKVAVLIGYAGTGYKGMQINTTEKTIEGDLFKAFIAAGAISKANANDPKKSSFVRCARTDKGVHAAGNVISLKLIVEDEDIVQKINAELPPQIRIWGFERTNGSFSCYQSCDSRWYEYLIPTYSFLPPHPRSYLGKKLVESVEREGSSETYNALQEDVARFWEEAEKTYVDPILEQLSPEDRAAVLEAIHDSEGDAKALERKTPEAEDGEEESKQDKDSLAEALKTEEQKPEGLDSEPPKAELDGGPLAGSERTGPSNPRSVLSPVEQAIKDVKAAYIKAKKAYRISAARRQRVQDALSTYLGTKNFHNYTVNKHFKDASAKRVIKSFKVGSGLIIINDTEWLSLKVHGQSFMMHQIRKMVAMAALVVRCGTPLARLTESFGTEKISIPKAPGLGLLLERPVFDSYNQRAVSELEREKVDFDKFNNVIEEFKQREIYERIFREEDKEHQFHTFFHHVDHFRTPAFLWVTATGIPAAKVAFTKDGGRQAEAVKVEMDSEDEADANVGNEEG